MLMTKDKTLPPKPDAAPEVVAAREQQEAAAAVWREADAALSRLNAALKNPDLGEAERLEAELARPEMERDEKRARARLSTAQAAHRAARAAAVEAWRPILERRFRDALKELDAVFEREVVPVNERARAVWAEAYALGIVFSAHFWTEFVEETSRLSTRLAQWRRVLKSEGLL